MVKVAKPTITALTTTQIADALLPAEAVLEGLVDTANVHYNGEGYAEIPTAQVTDLADVNRPIVGNKFFGTPTNGTSITKQLFDPLISLMRKNVVFVPLFGSAAHVINPSNTVPYTGYSIEMPLTPEAKESEWYKEELKRKAEWEQKNQLSDYIGIVLKHTPRLRPVTLRRLRELFDEGVIQFFTDGENIDPVDTIRSNMFVRKEGGVANITEDTPVLMANTMLDTNRTTPNALDTIKHSIYFQQWAPTYTSFVSVLNLTETITEGEYLTVLVDLVVLFEEVP